MIFFFVARETKKILLFFLWSFTSILWSPTFEGTQHPWNVLASTRMHFKTHNYSEYLQNNSLMERWGVQGDGKQHHCYFFQFPLYSYLPNFPIIINFKIHCTQSNSAVKECAEIFRWFYPYLALTQHPSNTFPYALNPTCLSLTSLLLWHLGDTETVTCYQEYPLLSPEATNLSQLQYWATICCALYVDSSKDNKYHPYNQLTPALTKATNITIKYK